jgi:Ca-activated chloride channel family protein
LFLILGLAQPSKIIKNSSVKIEGLAVEFVLDISGSMAENLILEQGQPISRLNLAKENIHYFLQGKSPSYSANSFKQNYEGRAGDFIGLVAFASRAQILVPLTLDHSAFLSVLDKIEPKKVPGSSETNIADALTLAIDKLQSLPEQRKLILLLTDGEQNVVAPFSGLNPIDLATLAAKLNIAIYPLDVGYPTGDKLFEETASSEEKEKRRQAQEGLRQLAQMTNGLILNASDEKSMADAFQKIGQLEQQSRLSLYSKPVQDFYPWCFFAGLFFCGLGIFLAGSRWQRIG